MRQCRVRSVLFMSFFFCFAVLTSLACLIFLVCVQEDELALCYFSSNKSKDVKGWIFLSDIGEITEHKSTLTVVSPAR